MQAAALGGDPKAERMLLTAYKLKPTDKVRDESTIRGPFGFRVVEVHD